VGCAAFSKINTWWFTLQDDQPTTPSPSFGIVGAGNPPPTKPLFDIKLSC
jgi:glucan endo-1,3-beta-D-glucosidase